MSSRPRFPYVLIVLALLLAVLPVASPVAAAASVEGRSAEVSAVHGDGPLASWGDAIHGAWDWLLSSLGVVAGSAEGTANNTPPSAPPEPEEDEDARAGMDPLG